MKAVLEPSASPPGSEPVVHLLRSDTATVTYSWDSPGLTTADGVRVWRCILCLGLVTEEDAPAPQFSWDIQLGSNSVINYGSYANHQR